MKLLQELLIEMGEYEEHVHQEYDKEEEAKEHAKQFLDHAASVLNYNKKPGDTGDVEKLALKYAKDYYDSICYNIKGTKYQGDEDSVDAEKETDYNDEVYLDTDNLLRKI